VILNNSCPWGDLRWIVTGFDVYFRGSIPLKGSVVLIVRKNSWIEPGEYAAAGDYVHVMCFIGCLTWSCTMV